ncbi:uncharacterized protein LOC132791320 [Drosophila nasuta]|uniref:uncharacterized protein LOC132791320 n=1 Tax=Drosophila nasuta TaxID=42062 RepID=UPI00295E520A|nr:uncharacterized protein LOC132791320 [Drosophila nasuta]
MYKIACFLLVALFGVVLCVPSQYDFNQKWVTGNLSYPLPSNPLVGGLDPYGYKIYVGRVNFTATVVPVNVVAETGIASGNTNNVPFQARNYHLLTTKDDLDYQWIRSYDGHLEDYAVTVGTSSWNEMVYICRAKSDGGIIIGSLFLTTKRCLLTAFGYEYIHAVEKYEVLVAVPKNETSY